jgi:cytoskeleton protein RodZ
MCHILGRGRVGASVIEIGATLTQARVRRGLGIAEAANATRLREHYLHALEQDRFDELPPGSYRRAFLRTY